MLAFLNVQLLYVVLVLTILAPDVAQAQALYCCINNKIPLSDEGLLVFFSF